MIPISDPSLPHRRKPVVNITLIGLNALVFLYELAADKTRFIYTFGLIPAELTKGADFTGLSTPQGLVDITTPGPAWITLFTAMFIHGGLLHFGGNMLYLWVFGDNIEDTLGHIPYLVFYLVAGLAASGAQIAIDMGSQVPVVGASGAIAGVLAGYLVLHPHSHIRTLIIFGFFITHARIPAIYLLSFWFVLQFFGGLGSLTAQGGGVAYWAHIGGFAAGLAIIGLYRLLARPRGPETSSYLPSPQ